MKAIILPAIVLFILTVSIGLVIGNKQGYKRAVYDYTNNARAYQQWVSPSDFSVRTSKTISFIKVNNLARAGDIVIIDNERYIIDEIVK